ncbi:hypothetical protein HDU67_009403, partial [Dinochytrium kinnereticum]
MPSKTKSKKGKNAAADQAKPAEAVATTSKEVPEPTPAPIPTPAPAPVVEKKAEAPAAAAPVPAIKKVKRVSLIGSQDQLTQQVVTALLEVFGRFDDDNDGALSRDELEAFAIATNGEKFEEDAVNELKKSFNVDANGNLTRRGFLEMYQLQTLSDPDETW